jgi:hypothetical protein
MALKSRRVLLSALVLPFLVLLVGCTKCVKFNNVPPTAQWGTPAGHANGALVHTEDTINVTVEEFYWSATTTHFGSTRVKPSFTVSGEQSINTNNINLQFDFTQLSFTPNKVTVIFRDTGGFENISVNGSTVIRGELASGSTGGISWTVDSTPEGNPSNRIGTVTIIGDVSHLKIGGQEFWIQSVCAQKVNN